MRDTGVINSYYSEVIEKLALRYLTLNSLEEKYFDETKRYVKENPKKTELYDMRPT